MRITVVLLAAVLLGTAVGGWASDNLGLRPEWSVGQEQVSPSWLTVTPPAPAPATLTLPQAVDLALARNTGFRWTISNLLAARGALWVARQRWGFTLTGSGLQNQDSQVATDFGSNLTYSAFSGATFSVQTEWDRLGCEETADTVTVTVSQPLLAGAGAASPAYEAVRAARNAYRSALLSYFNDRQNLIMGVVNSYFSLVEQHESLSAQHEAVLRAEEATKDVEMRVKEGLSIETELLLQEQTLANVKAAEVSYQQYYEQAMDQFMLQLGLQVGGLPELTSEVAYRPENHDVATCTKTALELRPELCQDQLALENGEAAVRIAHSETLPTLNLVGQWESLGQGLGNEWTVGLATIIPLGNRSLQQSYRQSEWSLLLARQALEDERQQVTADVRAQVRNASASEMQVTLAEQAVKNQERRLLQSQRMIDEGLGTNQDLVQSQSDLLNDQIQLITMRTNYFLAVMRLKVAMGVDVATALPAASPAAAAAPAPTPTPAPVPAGPKNGG